MAAFDWLKGQVARLGDVLPRQLLAAGFQLNGARIPLLGPQGIFKPKALNIAPLSLTTSPNSPYSDAFGSDELLRYSYRGPDPQHPDNVGLRFAMERKLPLVYFHGIAVGKYVGAWPVLVVRDNPKDLVFTVAVEDMKNLGAEARASGGVTHEDLDAMKRRYATSLVKTRLHQKKFRERVLEAYRHQCAFCRLRHSELLDAAHIIPDSDPAGEPAVRNGLALCSLHHGAFDQYFLGLRPDLVLEVRPDILREKDGPTMVHAIQALHGLRMEPPRRMEWQPEPKLVRMKYELFRASCPPPDGAY